MGVMPSERVEWFGIWIQVLNCMESAADIP